MDWRLCAPQVRNDENKTGVWLLCCNFVCGQGYLCLTRAQTGAKEGRCEPAGSIRGRPCPLALISFPVFCTTFFLPMYAQGRPDTFFPSRTRLHHPLESLQKMTHSISKQFIPKTKDRLSTALNNKTPLSKCKAIPGIAL